GASVFKVLVDPKPEVNGQIIIYAAVSGGTAPGVYRSLDSGKHWTLMRAGNATDLAFAAGSAAANGSGTLQVLYAAFRGDRVYQSPNQGAFWNKLLGNIGDPLIRDIDRRPPPALTVAAPGSLPTGAFGRIVLA